MVMILFFSALAFYEQVPSASAGDAFVVDVNLSNGKPSPIQFEDEIQDSVWYELPDEENYQLDISNSNIVCPSNKCKVTSYTDKIIFTSSDNYMALAGKFNLVDDQTNGHFTPKNKN